MAENCDINVRSDNKHQQPEHRDLYHYVYSFGSCVGVAVVDFVFLWPEDHFLALLTGAAWFALISIFELRHNHFAWRFGVPIGFLMAALIANWIIGPIRHPDIEVTGTILAADDTTPPNVCEKMGHPSGQIAIFLGTNVATRPEIGKFAILVRRGTPLVTIEKTADGIYIDASIFDSAGKLVGTVSKNKFTVLTGDNTYVERRGDLSTFGVYDKSGAEFLYVRFLNPKAMRIRGIFYSAGLPIAKITDTEIQLGGIHASQSCFGGGNIMGFD